MIEIKHCPKFKKNSKVSKYISRHEPQFYKFIFVSIFLLILQSCLEQGNIISMVDLNQKKSNNPIDPNTGKHKTSNFCNNKNADNFIPGNTQGNAENCIFTLCIDAAKLGFNADKFSEYSSYIAQNGGLLKNSDSICGDDMFKIPAQEVPFPAGFDAYHTYKEFVAEVNSIATNSQGIATLFQIGSSSEGQPLIMIRVSSDQKNADSRKALLVVGTHHAREHLATETPLLILKNLVQKAITDKDFNNILKTKTLYFVPVLNPDGTIYDLHNGNFQFWRKNTRIAIPSSGQRGVDLNRNYDSMFGGGGSSDNPSSETYHGPNAFSEPETQALKNFITQRTNINFILTYHSFSELVLYPWGGSNDKIPSNDFKNIKFISDKIGGMTGYTSMQASALYIATGDLCDWTYKETSKFCITIELSPTQSAGNNGFYPSGSIISSVVNKNIPVVEYLISILDNPKGVAP